MAFSVRRSAFLLVSALLIGFGGLACGGSGEAATEIVTDDSDGPIPTADQARNALNEALRAFNEHCISLSAQGSSTSYPVSLFNPDSDAPSLKYQQLKALSQAGLLDEKVTKDERDLPIHRFTLTKKGQSSRYDIAQGRRYEKRFCYAIPTVAQLDSIKAVYSSDPKPLANVWFSYTYQDLGRWVESREIQRAFSGMSPLPSSTDEVRTEELLIRVDSAWVDRRLTGYERPPSRPSP